MTPAPRAADAGITLVEMLVALAIFALVGIAAFATLDTILRIRDRTDGRLERLAVLDRALQVFGRDLAGANPVKLTLEEGVLGMEKSDTAGGRRYLLKDGGLIRETVVGPEEGTLEQVLVGEVRAVDFRVLSTAGTWAPTWPTDAQAPEARAVEMVLRLGDDSSVTRLVALPEAILP